MSISEMARCAASGSVSAQVDYGYALARTGRQIEAETWFEAAIAHGGAGMARAIAMGFELRSRGPVDVRAAERWYRRAYDLGSDWAAVQLGILLRNNGDLSAADHWFERAVERDGGRAAGRIAYNMNRGRDKADAERDAVVRAQWLRRAAELGDRAGMKYLAEALSAGNGVERDEAEAFRWYEAAARHPEADGYDLFTLAKLYVAGKGTPPDPVAAIPVLRSAKDKRFDDSDSTTPKEVSDLAARLSAAEAAKR